MKLTHVLGAVLVLGGGSLFLSACENGTTASSSKSKETAMNSTSDSTKPVAAKGAGAAEACAVPKPGEAAACGTGHWKGKTDAEWRKLLTPEQYQVARQAGTERAFTGKYWNTKTKGTYHCAACGQELFNSETKFDSGTGWPSFWQPLKPEAVSTHTDQAYGMVRTEVKCGQCDAHLGHVFDDGPPPTGQRYCMNSAVLNLVPTGEQDAARKDK